MKKSLLTIALSIFIIFGIAAQNENPMNPSDLPYFQIPDNPESYNAYTVTARVIDGLGFRYYWATEGLTEKDLVYRPSEEARSMLETIDHIHNLSNTILNSVKGEPNVFIENRPKYTFEELRKMTLEKIKMASDLAKTGKENEMDGYKIIFQREDGNSEWPFWNMLNGPISDAIYHTGQLVTFRRTTGNPKNPKVSVLRGRLRE